MPTLQIATRMVQLATRKGGEVVTRLKEVRTERGFTQAQLADAARVSRPFMHDLEKGLRGARADTWERIAEILGCDVDQIIEAKNDPEDMK